MKMLLLTKAALISIFILSGFSRCYASGVEFGRVVEAGALTDNKSGGYVDVHVYEGLGLYGVAGAELKRIQSHDLVAAYVGVSLFGWMQAQVGLNNHGPIYRFKSEIAPFSIGKWAFYYTMPRTNATWRERITLSLTYENTFRDNGLENVTLGVGYAF